MNAAKLSKKKTTGKKTAKEAVSPLDNEQQLINDLSNIGNSSQKTVRRIEVDSRRR